eukprot:Sspe_Gene.10107::Locus_3386_Transcript_1_1_Confidence_1.000_Length_1162::g.10107::m.10107
MIPCPPALHMITAMMCVLMVVLPSAEVVCGGSLLMGTWKDSTVGYFVHPCQPVPHDVQQLASIGRAPHPSCTPCGRNAAGAAMAFSVTTALGHLVAAVLKIVKGLEVTLRVAIAMLILASCAITLHAVVPSLLANEIMCDGPVHVRRAPGALIILLALVAAHLAAVVSHARCPQRPPPSPTNTAMSLTSMECCDP